MHRVKVHFMYHCDRNGTKDEITEAEAKAADGNFVYSSVLVSPLTMPNILRITWLFLHFDAFAAMNLIFMRSSTLRQLY